MIEELKPLTLDLKRFSVNKSFISLHIFQWNFNVSSLAIKYSKKCTQDIVSLRSTLSLSTPDSNYSSSPQLTPLGLFKIGSDSPGEVQVHHFSSCWFAVTEKRTDFQGWTGSVSKMLRMPKSVLS